VVEENTGVLLVEDRINEIQTLASDHLIMQEAGFLEVYINNEAQTPVYYDNFTVAATTSNVIEINAYYPYGMIMPGLSLMAPPGKWNGYKYNAKELETALNLGVYDFGRRMYDPIAPRFWTPDRFAEKYPWLSPYSYAGNNPINVIDINGDSLWINYDGGRMLYTAGMKYNGEDAFVSTVVGMLNKMNTVTSGEKLLNALSSSKNSFSFSNVTPTDKKGNPMEGTMVFDENANGGGTILAGSLMSGMSEFSQLESTSHELFHGYQHEQKQSGASVVNEVEANAFGYTVALNWTMQNDRLAQSASPLGVNSSIGQMYETAFSNLIYGKTFSASDFMNAAKSFKTGSQKGTSGLYNRYPFMKDIRNNFLLKPFYPLIP
jgi:RHS repeat-associated protein